MPDSPWRVTSFYRFLALSPQEVAQVREALQTAMNAEAITGLVIVAEEGINGTVARQGDLDAFKRVVCAQVPDGDVRFKDSETAAPPFKRSQVVLRKEIVGMKRQDLVPEATEDHHLSPAEWHAMLSSPNPPLLIDTRNSYEVKVGKFQGAIDPGLRSFSEWGQYLRESDFPREEPVLIYCTGGIRCEKAILAMREEGFHNVYQLRDGILGYLAEYPEGLYEGECYVFDDRVAVKPDLSPTERFRTCPACGLASDDEMTCAWCGDEFTLCPECREKWPPVCSKTCRDRYERHGAHASGRR